MKKTIIIFLAACLVCGLFLYFSVEPDSGGYDADDMLSMETDAVPRRFGATYMTMNNPFFGALNDGIKAIVEANGDHLITLDPALDQERQLSEIKDLIAQNVDAIFLTPVDWKAVKPALAACKTAGIPVINVDAPVYDEELVDCVIASDNYSAGVLCAEDMMKRLDRANIVLLEHPTAKSSIDRTQSFVDAIEGNENYKVVAQRSSQGQLEQAMPVMESIIASDTTIDVVMALNDPTVLGAFAALQSAGLSEDILLYGVDGSPDAKKMIKDGLLTATAAQSPKEIGQTAAETAYKLLGGEYVEKRILVPVTLITKENVDDVGVDGWQ